MTFALDISVRVIVAACAVALVLRVLRVHSASVRHAAWTVVLGTMLLMPLLPSVVPAVPLPVLASSPGADPITIDATSLPSVTTETPAAPTAVNRRVDGADAPTPVAAAGHQETSAPSSSWIPFTLVAIYLTGLALFLGQLLHGWRLAAGMIRRSVRCGSLPFSESAEVAVPLTAGAIRPVIVLPTAWRDWPADTLDAILAHEMAHVRRRDPLIALVARLNRALFWFHPLAWWLERQLAVTAEHACDEAAARTVAEPRRYAEILVEMADLVRRNHGRILWQAVGVNGAGLLQGRIERVLRGSGGRTSRMKACATLLMCAAAILLVVACRQQASAAQATPLREDPELSKRLAQQDENIRKSEAARDMTQPQADELEKKLEANPEDFEARRALVTYYGQSSTVAWDKKVPGLRRHALWLIEHHPEHDVWAPPLSPQYDLEGFADAKKLWEAHLAKPDASPYLIYRAASFFVPHDKSYAEQLILRGMKMDPDSSALKARMAPNVGGYQWPSQLATLYASAINGSENMWGTYNDLRTHLDRLNSSFAQEVRTKLEASTDARLLAAVGGMLARPRGPVEDRAQQQAQDRIRALGISYLQRAVQLDSSLASAKRALYLATAPHDPMNDAARAVAAANRAMPNNPEEARRLAEDALKTAQSHNGDPAYSAAAMAAHHVLATLAAKDGDRDAAVHHLQESVRVPSSDEIRYVTPLSWMKPVNALLKEGERDRIADFLDAFAQLVGSGPEADRFRTDAAAIREGRMPVSYQHAAYRETTPSPFKPMR